MPRRAAVKLARALLAPLTPVTVFALAGGCALFAPPELPAPPEPKPPEVPEFKPPDAPEPPKSPYEIPKDGNCCMRNTEAVSTVCRGAARCCTDKYERSDCEDAGGLWFNTPEGCGGAC